MTVMPPGEPGHHCHRWQHVQGGHETPRALRRLLFSPSPLPFSLASTLPPLSPEPPPGPPSSPCLEHCPFATGSATTCPVNLQIADHTAQLAAAIDGQLATSSELHTCWIQLENSTQAQQAVRQLEALASHAMDGWSATALRVQTAMDRSDELEGTVHSGLYRLQTALDSVAVLAQAVDDNSLGAVLEEAMRKREDALQMCSDSQARCREALGECDRAKAERMALKEQVDCEVKRSRQAALSLEATQRNAALATRGKEVAERSLEEKESKLGEVFHQLVELKSELSAVQRERAELEQLGTSLRERCTRTDEEMKAMHRRLKCANAQHQSGLRDKAMLQEQLESAETKYRSSVVQRDALQEQCCTLQCNRNDLERALSSAQDELGHAQLECNKLATRCALGANELTELQQELAIAKANYAEVLGEKGSAAEFQEQIEAERDAAERERERVREEAQLAVERAERQTDVMRMKLSAESEEQLALVDVRSHGPCCSAVLPEVLPAFCLILLSVTLRGVMCSDVHKSWRVPLHQHQQTGTRVQPCSH
jgi:hypothetical protein